MKVGNINIMAHSLGKPGYAGYLKAGNDTLSIFWDILGEAICTGEELPMGMRGMIP